jgi:hypothetical protein
MLRDGIYWYIAASSAFLDRARDALSVFQNDDDVQSLFVAALMLRLGIEARLFEYIEAELPRESRRAELMRISDYQATNLLRRLIRMNPNASDETLLIIREESGGEAFGLRYTPVTKSLASLHGQLGELLHFNYFKKNPYWYVADRADAPGLPTLLHASDLIERGIAELAEATSGQLLNHPSFKMQVQQLVEEIEADNKLGDRE